MVVVECGGMRGCGGEGGMRGCGGEGEVKATYHKLKNRA